MDILGYFQINEHPFHISPDPRFLYFSEQVKEAISKCQYMAAERIGPLYMYGPIGSGKTSVLRRLYELLSSDERYNVHLLISPNIKTSNAYLRVIMDTFDVPTDRSYDRCLRNFENFLLEQYQAGKIPVLLIDEAQNLNRDCLKLVHYLLNFETNTVKLLQLVLAGQEELQTKIMRYRELASRMFPIAIHAMTPEDLRSMIAFRWTVAGGNELPFAHDDPNIYRTLYVYTKGLPRDAIKVCDEALRELVATQETTLSAQKLEEIANELNLSASL